VFARLFTSESRIAGHQPEICDEIWMWWWRGTAAAGLPSRWRWRPPSFPAIRPILSILSRGIPSMHACSR